MYAEALKPITDTMRKFPGVWDLPDTAGADKIKRLAIEVRTALNLSLPDEYITFLKECDGLEFDGYIIYGTDHFLETQADYEDIAKQHIIFAEYDTGWFCMKKSDGSFGELDKPSGQEMRQFLCAGDMIRHILSSAANRADS